MNSHERRIVETLRREAERLPDPDAVHTITPPANNPPRLARGLAAPAAVVAVLVLAAPLIWIAPGIREGGPGASVTTATAQDPGAQPVSPDGPMSASPAEIEILISDGYYEIALLTLAEDASRVETELQALGLDVTIDFVPVSPSLIGELVATSESGSQRTWHYIESSDGTSPVLRVPTDFDGSLALQVGRAAAEGEAYVSAAKSALEPGEALHCTGVEGMTVAEAASAIAGVGTTVEYYDASGDGTPLSGDQVPQDWYIVATTPASDDIVHADLMPVWPNDGRTADYLEFLNEGCN